MANPCDRSQLVTGCSCFSEPTKPVPVAGCLRQFLCGGFDGTISNVIRRIRRLDEFQKRVHFEAVVVGFLATGLAVFVYGYLQKAHAVAPLNMALVWAFMLLFYAIGYVIATNHYK